MPAANNTGACTASMTNPKWTRWNQENPGKKLNPYMKKLACSCRAFSNAGNRTYPNKCICNHDNKHHL
ncbi:hypothetical protein DHEL01_v203586 [Diaporthe helianthi]|uniref:Uncharacterized protein n=1 Tax=Diaporthe helianthi TaxID=158607 RepID=A0A2P5I696_DIAHE|nr:hypothetical protein DHEL01_v203586 [Diaporthe helianthi]